MASAPGESQVTNPVASQDREEEAVEEEIADATPIEQEGAWGREVASNDGGSNITTPAEVASFNSEHMVSLTSTDLSDRVFPIRSVVSVDFAGKSSSTDLDRCPRMTNHARKPRLDTPLECGTSTSWPSRTGSPSVLREALTDSAHAMRKRSRLGLAPDAITRTSTIGPVPLFFDAIPEKLETTETVTSADGIPSMFLPSVEERIEPMVTARFKHVIMDGGHAVITGRYGVLQRCEDEPIHTPGAVQGFGVLLALREVEEGQLQVRYVSENSEKLIGYTPHQLFRLEDFLSILSEEQQGNLLDHVDLIKDEATDPAAGGPEVFSLSIRGKERRSVKFWCAIHVNCAHPDLIICELELDDDTQYPLYPGDHGAVPTDVLHSQPTSEELLESTETISKPLRILRSARNRSGEAGAMQVFDIMSQVQDQLASASHLDTFLKILVGTVKDLTGFHRVMIYQFDASFNGKVVAELVDATQSKDLYHGLHFPASDIPWQARELYKINKVRLLYDRDLDSARLVCRSKGDLDIPLDMTHSYLRAMSPIHLKYLANIQVRSSMSISINAFGELWGLISCHSYGPKGMRVSFPIRKLCRLVGEIVSRNIERLSYASRLQARKLIDTACTDKNPSGYIVASSDDLLKLFDADCGLLSIQGETKILGKIEQSQEALAMFEYLRVRKLTSVFTSHDISQDFPDLRYPPGFQAIAGILYVPLSIGGNDFIVFFRYGQIKEVKWAGNPYQKIIQNGTTSYLEPRTSFKAWHETVLGKCRDWTEEQIETAAVLCLVYGKFIEVWRQKEAALRSSRLTRLLLANSAHEVRTPLNAIINYLEIALEGSLDQETRDNLAKSHSASKSLVYVINDLLDLTKTEEGQNLIKDEVFDLGMCIKEATDPFKADAKRKGVAYEVVEDPGLPRFVHGDGRRVRQAVSNITANAVAHTATGTVKVEAYAADVNERRVIIEIAVQDTGRGMTTRQLDALFQELEQVSTDAQDPSSTLEPPDEQQTLGLGLAVVARIVRNMHGQLRLKSEEGKGSKFVIQLPFEVPGEHSESAPEATGTSSMAGSIASLRAGMERPQNGEITLVERRSSVDPYGEPPPDQVDPGHISLHSMDSKGSTRSSRSDADQLISAMSMPLTFGDDRGPGSPKPQRQLSAEQSPAQAGGTFLESTTSGSLSRRSIHDLHTTPQPVPQQARIHSGFISVEPQNQSQVCAVKVPDKFVDAPVRQATDNLSRLIYEIPVDNVGKQYRTDSLENKGQSQGELPPPQPPPHAFGGPANQVQCGSSLLADSDGPSLQVLIAEDDPINMRLLRKRLEKAGHVVRPAVNGDDCATIYREKSSTFDVVLMDIQMPIMDGLTSATMIRAHEKSSEQECVSSNAASANGRVPIFAVSASLVEGEKDTYTNAGFDGWILKPIDFKRLGILLRGIQEEDVRNKCLFVPGAWEKGGWFFSREGLDAEHKAAPEGAGGFRRRSLGKSEE